MKTLILGMFLLGLTSLTFAQGSDEKNFDFEEKVPIIYNEAYLEMVQDELTPLSIFDNQMEVAQLDIKSTELYDAHRPEPFEVNFVGSQGNIRVLYNKEGQIKKSFEKFRGVKLPQVLQDRILNDNPGWAIIDAKYACTYYSSGLIKRGYKLYLSNGIDKKKIVLNYN